jgi:uncharacterized protein YggE
MHRIMELIEDLKVKPEDVMTGYVNIRREFFEDERGRPQGFKHWSVRRDIKVKERDLSRFDEFFDKLTSAGDVEVRFNREATNIHELRWETRQQAVGIAERKAQEMLAELDARLGNVLTVDEHPPGDRRDLGRFEFSNNAFIYPTGETGIDAVSGTFAPGTLDIQITVYVTFEIE